MLIMKSLYVLAVAVAAVAASRGCLSYCDILYMGWKIAKRSDCNCFNYQKKMQDETNYVHDLKKILLPLKSQNREPIFKDHHKSQEYYRISRTDDSKSNKVKPNKIKRTVGDGKIPIEKIHNSSITSNLLDHELNNIDINEKNLTDCIDLHILINIRKNKNKGIATLESNGLEKYDNLNDLEINTEIKSKCDQITTIIERSVKEIKEHQKLNNKKKNQTFNATPKINTNSASEVIDKTTPMIYTKEDINNSSVYESTLPNEDFDSINNNPINNTLILNTENLNDFNSSTLENNNTKEITDKSYNLKYLNDSVFMDDNNTMNTTDLSSKNLLVNTTTITKLQNIINFTENNNDLPSQIIELQKNNLNDELLTRKSLNPVTFPDRTENKNIVSIEDSDNVKDSTVEIDKFITNIDNIMNTKINLNEDKSSLRDTYNESEVPVVRVITREYPNDTVSSIINGTEILPNSDFKEDTIINNKTETTSDINIIKNISPESEIQSRSDDTTPFASEKQTFANTSPTINGRLHFVYGEKHIPGNFVQTPDGQLQLSLDMNTICNELIKKKKFTEDSLLISVLCQYVSCIKL